MSFSQSVFLDSHPETHMVINWSGRRNGGCGMWVGGWKLGEVGGNVGRRDFPDRDDEWCVAVSVCIIVVVGQFILFYFMLLLLLLYYIMRISNFIILLYCIVL